MAVSRMGIYTVPTPTQLRLKSDKWRIWGVFESGRVGISAFADLLMPDLLFAVNHMFCVFSECTLLQFVPYYNSGIYLWVTCSGNKV